MFTGAMIAPGIASGPTAVWTPASTPVPRREIRPASVPAEMQRLDHALRRARRELEEIALRVEITAGKSAANIFRAHEAILEDAVFDAAIRKRIEEEKLAAESAVAVTVEEYHQRFATLGNEYLAARGDDIVDLGRRLLAHLRKEGPRQVPRPPVPSVLVVENLSAADVIALDRENLLALVMMQSGATSHAALLASTLGVPVVGGVPELAGQLDSGDMVIVDGNHGHVLVSHGPFERVFDGDEDARQGEQDAQPDDAAGAGEEGNDEADHHDCPQYIAEHQEAKTTESVAQCTDRIRSGRVEYVTQRVKQRRDLGGGHGTVRARQKLRRRQDQQRVGEIACAKDAHADQKAAKVPRQGPHRRPELDPVIRGTPLLLDHQGEGYGRPQTWHEGQEKDDPKRP